MKTLFASVFLLSASAHALEPAAGNALSALGTAAASEARAPEVSPAEDAELARLRAEALSGLEDFIDTHTPYETALALGLPSRRFWVTARDWIETAKVTLTVDLSRQRLVMDSAAGKSEFLISSGKPPEHTTPGSGRCYSPDFLEEMHYSSLYNSAPMPHSVFFNGNIAIHATEAEWLLGRPASHGCIRLSKADAETVYRAVKAAGKNNSVICVKGTTPASPKS